MILRFLLGLSDFYKHLKRKIGGCKIKWEAAVFWRLVKLPESCFSAGWVWDFVFQRNSFGNHHLAGALLQAGPLVDEQQSGGWLITYWHEHVKKRYFLDTWSIFKKGDLWKLVLFTEQHTLPWKTPGKACTLLWTFCAHIYLASKEVDRRLSHSFPPHRSGNLHFPRTAHIPHTGDRAAEQP